MAVFALAHLEMLERRNLRRERVFRDRENAFELHEASFRELFRLPRHLVIELVEDLRPHLPQPSRTTALDAETRVLAALNFFATGSYQRSVGRDLSLCLSQPSVSRCVTSVSRAMSTHLFSKWVKFPTSKDEMLLVKKGFQSKFNFPGVIGIIDGTHIAIVAPSTDAQHQESAFVCRKGFHSINVQMVADSGFRILNVNAKFPGSTHDSFIWANCSLRRGLVAGHDSGAVTDSWLLGDSGYPLEPWLLTPIAAPLPGSGEEEYNAAHSKLRPIVERTFGLLKNVWRCTLRYRTLHHSPETAGDIIISCAILHNIFVENNLRFPELRPGIPADEPLNGDGLDEVCQQRRGNPLATHGRRIQQLLIRNNFRLH